jgi:hypothetical protein
MAIGGSCASGGPYASARQCPDVTWLRPVGLVGGAIMALDALGRRLGRRDD